MLADAAIALLTRRFQAATARHIAHVGSLTERAWLGLAGWDEANVAEFAAAVESIQRAAKASVVSSTSAYLSLVASLPTVGVDPELVPARSPDPREPFTAMWRAMKEGQSFDEALQVGQSAASQAITSHLNQASRQTGDQWAKASGAKVVGWRRVLDGSSCEWCALVSTQRYRSSESASFGHHGCGCGVIAIIGERDPGRFLGGPVAENLDPHTSRRIDLQRLVSDKVAAAENATRRRDDALAELRTATDPERRRRLEGRARKWDAKAAHYHAQAATNAAPTIGKPAEWTGYVDQTGQPTPRPQPTPTG